MRKKQSKTTKIMPKVAIILVIAAIIFSIIKLNSTKASTDIVEITSVEIAAKSDTTDVDSVKFEDGKIKNNVEFHKVGDYLTYNVTITNKEDKDYIIKSITDNNGNENLAYSYSGYEGAKLEAKKAAMFQVTITYAKEVEIDKRNQSNLVALTLTFEDEAGNEQEQEVIVDPTDDNKEETVPEKQEESKPAAEKDKTPQTGDKVGIYVAVAVVALAILIILSRRKLITNKKNSRSNKNRHGKHGKRILGLILALVLVVPAFSNISKAVTTTATLSTSLDTTIKFMDRVVVSYEIDGETFEQVIPYDGTLEDLENPTKEGFEFNGWILEDGTPLIEEIKITADTVLVPQFTELEKSSEITISVKDEKIVESEKEVTISAVNTNIADSKVQLQYSLDDGETWTNYEGALTIRETVTLKARTIIKENEALLGTAEKEIFIDPYIGTLREYFVGKTVNDVYDQSNNQFINNEILPDASSIGIINGYETNDSEVVVISYKDYLYLLEAKQPENEIIFTAVEPMDDINAIKAYMYTSGLRSLDMQNWYFLKDESTLIDEDLKITYLDLDFANYIETFVVEYKDKTYKIAINEYTGDIEVSDASDFNPTDKERLQSYFNLLLVGIGPAMGANYDEETGEYTQDTIGILDSNVKILTDMQNDPIYIEYKDKNYIVTRDAETESMVVMDIEDYFKCTINIDGTPVTGKVTLQLKDEKVLTVTDCDEDVTYASSDESVLTIDSEGNIKAKALGTAKITVTGAETGKTKTITLDVKKIFTVTFDKNAEDATGTMSNITFEEGRSTYISYNQFSRPGYHFVNWNTKADGSGTSYSSGSYITTFEDADENFNVTLYAQWEINTYKIRYYSNGGSGSMEVQTMTYGTPANLTINTFTRSGYRFTGWNTSSNGTGTSYTDGQEVNNLTTSNGGYVYLYAQWEQATYTVVFNKNAEDATGTMSNQTMSYGTSANLYSNGFTRTGYTFNGWNTEVDGSGTSYRNGQSVLNLSEENGATVALYAQWKKIPVYTVVYDSNGGTGTMESQSITYGTSVKLNKNTFINKNTNPESYFNGWNTEADGSGTSYNDKQSVSNLTNIDGATVTLYAQWRGIQVGDTILYTPSTVNTYSWDQTLATSDAADDADPLELKSGEGQSYNISQWYVLSIDGDNITMVPKTPSSGTVTLQSAQGYNNAVKLLNDACSTLYSDSSKGITARSINIEDIENVIKNYGNESTLTTAQNSNGYNTQKYNKYTLYKQYPEIYASENQSVINENKNTSGLGLSAQSTFIQRAAGNNDNGSITTATSIQPYQTYYYLSNSDLVTALGGSNSIYRKVLLNNSTPNYWVASRCVNLYSGICYFYVSVVRSGYLGAGNMLDSYGNPSSDTRGLFPVVSLSSDVLTTTGTAGTYQVQ